MKTFNHIEYNKLCACFLNAIAERWYPATVEDESYGIWYAFPTGGWYPDNKRYHNYSLMKFDSDWNWIMEVCKKVDNLPYKDIAREMNGISDSITPYINAKREFLHGLCGADKEVVVLGLWNFLNWYYEK